MSLKKISAFVTIMFLANTASPLFAQVEAPSKFEMKKDGDGDGVKLKG